MVLNQSSPDGRVGAFAVLADNVDGRRGFSEVGAERAYLDMENWGKSRTGANYHGLRKDAHHEARVAAFLMNSI